LCEHIAFDARDEKVFRVDKPVLSRARIDDRRFSRADIQNTNIVAACLSRQLNSGKDGYLLARLRPLV
jgi:hypothetical protein